MNQLCPVSFKQIDERVSQFNAVLVIISLIFFFLTPYKWIIWVLSVDFFIRGFLNPSFSFYAAISRTILRILKIKALMIDAEPKIFAAKIGFIFSVIIGVCYLFDFQIITLIFGSIFIFFAALEAIFKFCIACKFYPFIYKIKFGN